MRSIRLFVVTAFLALAACSAPAEIETQFIAVSTQPPPVGQQACMQALLSGTLVTDMRWGIAVRAPDGEVIHVAWPNGYVGRTSETGVELLDRTGAVVGHVGDRIEIGGGLDAAGTTWFACG